MVKNINVLHLPIKVILVYLILTYTIYSISPWNWSYENYLLTTIFNIAVWVALYCGFKWGVSKPVVFNTFKRKIYRSTFWSFLAILSIYHLYPLLLVRFQVDNLSIGYIFTRTFLGGLDLKDAYFSRGENTMQLTSAFSSIPIFVYVFFSPLVYLYKYVSLFFWKDISRFHKFVVVFIIAVDILGYIAIGTNKGIFDYVLTIPLIIFASQKMYMLKSVRISYKSILAIIIALMLSLNFFGSSYSSRMEDSALTSNSVANSTINYDSPILKIIPSSFEVPYLGLDFYLSHAYSALDMAMGMDFIPCYGMGNSPLLNQWCIKFGFGEDIPHQRYESRIAKQRGVDEGLYWHTAYVAFANDISFLGVPFFLFFLAGLYGYLWKQSLYGGDYIAIPIVMLLTIELFYLNANNQIFGKSQLVSFVFLFLYWYCARLKRSY